MGAAEVVELGGGQVSRDPLADGLAVLEPSGHQLDGVPDQLDGQTGTLKEGSGEPEQSA